MTDTTLPKTVVLFALTFLAAGAVIVILTGCVLPQKPPTGSGPPDDSLPGNAESHGAYATCLKGTLTGGTTAGFSVIPGAEERPLFWWWDDSPLVTFPVDAISGHGETQVRAQVAEVYEPMDTTVVCHIGAYDAGTGLVVMKESTIDLLIVPPHGISIDFAGDPRHIQQGERTWLTIMLTNEGNVIVTDIEVCLEYYPTWGTIVWHRAYEEGRKNITIDRLAPGESFAHAFEWLSDDECEQGQYSFTFNATFFNHTGGAVGPTAIVTVVE